MNCSTKEKQAGKSSGRSMPMAWSTIKGVCLNGSVN